MLSLQNNVSALSAQANLQRTNSALANSITRLSANVRLNSSQQTPALPGRVDNSAAIAAQQAVAKTQTEEANLGNASETLSRMSSLVQQAAGSNTSAADRDAINQQLSDLKGQLKTLSDSTSSDALSKFYDGGNGASYSVTGAAGSRDISVSASTTADDYAGMLTALKGAQEGVTAARASNGAALSAATQNYTDSVASSAKDAGLDVREIPQLDVGQLTSRASGAAAALAEGRLAITNAMGGAANTNIFALLRG